MKSVKILLVEDNPDDEFLTTRILCKLGYSAIDVVHQGGEALEYLFGEETHNYSTAIPIKKPDVILLDMRMPLINGIEFLEAAHANLKTHEIPVIVISSSKQEKEVNRCIELGAKAFLNKPLDSIEIGRAIVDYCPNHP
ncbi:two-component response regulator ARR17 [Geobacter sp. OR-1]|uniref:response regulator n=1 Tax=Geobacter sp. OR-1 TaxID=1266765 RepID=UPI000541A727|nr:response regulator [Geobacter sp. OR-1]GAM08796.1 two-component response regulator ARR17 [Geobacter sp. OR-1]